MKPFKWIKVKLFVKPPELIRLFTPGFVWRLPREEKVLFLTFDDGPTRELTPWILEELARRDALATFFCVGSNVKEQPDLYQAILEKGHGVGNHTHRHLNGYKTGLAEYVRDVYRAGKWIRSPLFRPPYGRIRPLAARILRLRYHLVMWDVLSMDYDATLTPGEVLENVIRETRDGSILVFHDNRKALSHVQAVLPSVLDHYLARGYKFLPLTKFLT